MSQNHDGQGQRALSGLSLCRIRKGSPFIADKKEREKLPVKKDWGADPELRRLNGGRDRSQKHTAVSDSDSGLWVMAGGSLCARPDAVLPQVLEVPAAYQDAAVTQLGDSAFSDHAELRRVILPEGIVRLDDYSFWKCIGLEEVLLPQSLRWIGNWAFGNCARLGEIRLPEGLLELGEDAFFCCENLSQIYLPSTLRVIQDRAFIMCRGLLQIEIPDSVEYIGANAFSCCDSLQQIILPQSWKGRPVELGKASLPEDCRIHYR